MKKEKVYISGPMSHLSREEYLARFAYVEQLLRADGYDVVNPARLAPSRWPWLYKLMGYKLTLLYDIWWMLRCDYMHSMPCNVESKGAAVEFAFANTFDIPYPPKDTEYFEKTMKFIKERKEKCQNNEQ